MVVVDDRNLEGEEWGCRRKIWTVFVWVAVLNERGLLGSVL